MIDPDDREYKEMLKNAMGKLERPVAPAMPCRRPPKSIRETCVNQLTAKPNSASEESPKRCSVEKWSLTNPRDNEQNFHGSKTMKTTLQEKDLPCSRKSSQTEKLFGDLISGYRCRFLDFRELISDAVAEGQSLSACLSVSVWSVSVSVSVSVCACVGRRSVCVGRGCGGVYLWVLDSW